jgi:hypothetical protein
VMCQRNTRSRSASQTNDVIHSCSSRSVSVIKCTAHSSFSENTRHVQLPASGRTRKALTVQF